MLTGATGSLGAQLIPELLARDDVREIVCLCRADTEEEARQRVLQSLAKQLIGLQPQQEDRLRCLPARFDALHLGLDEQTYRTLSDSRLLVIHAAWPVHFGAGLGSFVSHLEGDLRMMAIVTHRRQLIHSPLRYLSQVLGISSISQWRLPPHASSSARQPRPFSALASGTCLNGYRQRQRML